MIYRITYNSKRQKMATRVKNREEFLAIRNSQTNLNNLAKARKGDAKAKADLVQFAYNLGHVDGLIAGCKSIGSYFFHDIDCYDKEQAEAICKQILDKKDEIGLKMLEHSASGGYHLVCKRVPNTTILENQVRIACILKVADMDNNARDLQRVVFGTSGSSKDLIFLDNELFDEPMSAEECEAEYARLKERERRGEEQLPLGAKKANKHYRPWEEDFDINKDLRIKGNPENIINPENPCKEYPKDYHGIPFEAILKKYWELNNGGFEPNIGDRDTLTFQLASDLRHICGRSAEWLDQVIPCYDGFPLEEKRQKIVNALKSSYEGMPGRLKTVLDALKGRTSETESSKPTMELDPNTPMSELSKLFASSRPPELPKILPKLVKEVTRNTPQKYKATVSQAMFPPLATYPRHLSFVYIDNQERDLRVNCLIVAITGSGKDSSTGKPLERLIAPMKLRDEENRVRLKKFNDECNSKAANKQSPKRPDDLIIQTIMSDITKAGLVQRMDEAQGAPLYVKLNELEQWDKIEAASGRSNQFTVMKLCDDEHNIFGTDRAGTQSVTATGCLHLNWNASTTISKAIRYFRHVLTDGPVSRLCLATIPEDEIGADISVFGDYDEAYDAALKPYIENLSSATGIVDCLQAKKLARKLKDECADFARLSQDRVFDNLSHRALVIAFRKACLLYVANGMRWEKSIETFCRWSLFYDLYMKMTLFGDMIRHADDEVPTSKHGPQSLLDLLPATFTIEDARRIRTRRGMAIEKTGNLISTWKKRHYVVQMADGSYKKASISTPNKKEK